MLAVGVALVAVPSVAEAAPQKPAKAKKKEPEVDLKAIADLLQSGDPAKVSDGLKRARAAGKDAAPLAPLVNRLLQRGLPNELARQAIDAAGALADVSSSRVLREYARHRDVEVRRAAVAALLKTKGPDAVAAMRQALSDADGRVRGIAASGLGALGARKALKDLDAALDHRVPEAAAAIGQLCRVDECEAFAKRTGQVPFDIMTSGFDQILFRPSAEIPDDAKIRLVGRIRELGTGEAHRFLKDVLSRWSGSAAVKASLEQAVQATEGSPGAAGGGS